MVKKRSKGVTFWALFLIAGSLWSLYNFWKRPGELFLYTIQSLGVIFFFYTLFTDGAYLICGIYLLKLNNLARKFLILFSIVNLILIPSFIYPVSAKIFSSQEYYLKRRLKTIQKIEPQKRLEAFKHYPLEKENSEAQGPIVIVIIFEILFMLPQSLMIYFFTRPKVKEQFSGLGARDLI